MKKRRAREELAAWISPTLPSYLKKPEYFLPSVLGPVELDLISARLPSLTSVGLVYDFTKYLHFM